MLDKRKALETIDRRFNRTNKLISVSLGEGQIQKNNHERLNAQRRKMVKEARAFGIKSPNNR